MIPQTIFEHYQRKQDDYRRDHLGASRIGIKCNRALFYEFRWCYPPGFDGRILRLFETGHFEETRLLNNLKDIGLNIHDEQTKYNCFGGHYAGSIDAMLDDTIVEIKTMSAKKFKDLKIKGIPGQHLAQMQQYMHSSGCNTANYFVVCKDTDDIYHKVIEYDNEYAKLLMKKADEIIFRDDMPDPYPTYYDCMFCAYKPLCDSVDIPEINCRTCAHVTICADGWLCEMTNKPLDSIEQRIGCPKHIYNPGLIPLQVVNANEEENWIEYEHGMINENSEQFRAEYRRMKLNECI